MEYIIFEFLEADYAESIKTRRRRRMQLRAERDPFKLDEAEFIKKYRLTKQLTRNLCDDIRPMMPTPVRTTDICVETKVLIALAFYASGSYQSTLGGNKGHFVSQQTVSSAISQVTACLNSSHMQQKYNKFPMNDEDRKRIISEFHNKFGIPGVLGCIGCGHVAIIRPKLQEERYNCHKGYYTLNVQLICDANKRIISVDASNGGATDRSLIWANHPLRAQMEDLSHTENIWLLGDSGYPLEKTIMTSIPNAAPNSPEEHYNDLHTRARDTIDRTIQLLKARFRCLLLRKALHYKPKVSESLVNACVVLHNICNEANIPLQELSQAELMKENQLQLLTTAKCSCHNKDASSLATRSCLVQRLWENRGSTS